MRVPLALREDCETQVKGYTGARYKKFKSQREAEDFIATQAPTSTALVPSSSRSRLLPVPVTRNMAQPNQSSGPSKPKVNVSRKDAGVDEEGFDVIYADGACKGNGQANSVAGVGVWWGHNDPRYEFGTLFYSFLTRTLKEYSGTLSWRPNEQQSRAYCM